MVSNESRRFEMKKILLFILVPFLFWCSCTEKTYNYYLTEEKGSLAGVVEPAESGARVSAWQGKEVAFTYVDSAGYFIITDLPVGTYAIKVEAEGHSTYESKPNYTVYGGGTTTVGTITLNPFPDLISSVYPPDKAVDVSVCVSIQIHFKESMDKESVIDGFSISPAIQGSFDWKDKPGYYGTVLEFNPAYNLLPGTAYIIELDTQVQDTAGNHLTQPFSFSFTTVGVGIERFSPPDGQTDVGTDIYIYIYFTTVMNRQSVEDAFSIDPPTSGSFEWDESPKSRKKVLEGSADRLWFKPDGFLKTSTLYTVTLDTTAQDTSGVGISESLQFSFTTEDLRIRSTYPRDGYTGLRTTSRISVCFNTMINKASAEEAFSTSPPVVGDFIWRQDLTCFDFVSRSGYLAANTTYQVKIDTTASDLYDDHLSETYQFSFTTEEISLIHLPYDNSTGISTSTGIRVSFNTGMNPESVENGFSITPAVEGSFAWSMTRQFNFGPSQVLASNTLYTVNIDSSAQDMYGAILGRSYSFSFTTEEIRITLTNPRDGATYVDPDANIEIYFNTDMDQASVVDAFKMMDSDSVEVEGGFTWSDLRRFTYDPSSSLALDEEYTVSISTDALDVTGVPMPEEFVLWFKTRP